MFALSTTHTSIQYLTGDHKDHNIADNICIALALDGVRVIASTYDYASGHHTVLQWMFILSCHLPPSLWICIRLPHRISIMTVVLRVWFFLEIRILVTTTFRVIFPLLIPSTRKMGGTWVRYSYSPLFLFFVFLASAAPPVLKFYQNNKTLFSQTGGVLDLSPSLFDRKCLAISTTTGYTPECWSQSPCVQQKSFYALDPS